MNRRKFLNSLLYGLGAAVAVRKFPFSVYSFPKEVKPINVAPRVPQEIIDLWKQELEAVNRYGPHFEGEWWMHPIQLAALRELGFGYPYIEIRKVGNGPFPYSSPDLYPPSTLFGVPIKECPYFRPDAKPVLMVPFPTRASDILVSVSDVPDLYPLTPERPRNPFPYPSRLQRT